MNIKFLIGTVDSASEHISNIIIKELKIFGYFKNNKDKDKIKIMDLARIIFDLQFVLHTDFNSDYAKNEILIEFGLCGDSFDDVIEYITMACNKLTECLIHETMFGRKFVIAECCQGE